MGAVVLGVGAVEVKIFLGVAKKVLGVGGSIGEGDGGDSVPEAADSVAEVDSVTEAAGESWLKS